MSIKRIITRKLHRLYFPRNRGSLAPAARTRYLSAKKSFGHQAFSPPRVSSKNTGGALAVKVFDKISSLVSRLLESLSKIPSAAILANFLRCKKRRRRCAGCTPRRSDEAVQEIGYIPSGCGYFLIPLRCGFVAVSVDTASSPRLADIRKSLATRLECILEMDSSYFHFGEVLTMSLFLAIPSF